MSGNADRAKGRAKEAAGSLTGDQDLKNEGRVDQASGDIKEKVTGVIDSVKKKLTRK